MFVNLHQHTHYSLLDGCAQIKPLVKRAADLDMPSLAITDHGTLAGSLEFYLECKRAGINPIVGVEAYVDDSKSRKEQYRHVVLLAKNYKGYLNLLKIVSEAYVNGFYYRPRTTTEKIFEHGEGLIVSSACMGGIIAKTRGRKQARHEAEKWKDRFGNDFYIEIQFNEIAGQKPVNAMLVSVAEEVGVKVLPTLDAHYVHPEDIQIQDFVLLVRDKKNVDRLKEVAYKARSLYLMTGKELWQKASEFGFNYTKAEFKRLIRSTKEVSDKCDLEIPTGSFHLPDMGMSHSEFKRMVKHEFKQFHFYKKTPIYERRLKKELKIISKLGFHDYFLIVKDLVSWCRQNDIFVGPARGSVAGSLASFVLGITKIDPIKHGLIFERFLNESRVDMPDIDLDFDANKRDRVLAYIADKYGHNKVARVISFGTFGQVGALKDVGRVFKLPQRPINEIASAVYRTGSLKDARKDLSGLLLDFWDEHKKEIRVARRVATMIRNAGVHPCGLIIAPKPVYKFAPLQRVKGDIVSAYSEGFKGRELTEIGLIKFDILGLNTCSIISDALDLVKEHEGEDHTESIWDLDLTDEKLLNQARKGNTTGGFQFETDSATKLLRKVKPRTFYEIAALNAINRPGPLASGAVERFHNHEGMGIENDEIEKALKETRGVLVYQEQVMRLLHKIAGYSLVEADNIRKLAAKKIFSKRKAKKFRKEFMKRCAERIGRDDAKRLWDIIGEFTQYSFNKSHAVSYAYLFFQVLFLKNYHPGPFFVSLLSNTATGTIKDRKHGSEKNKLYRYINEARQYGLKIFGPDINRSGIGFGIEKKGIRFGLSKIKGIKGPTAEEIVSKQPFSSFNDFMNKVSGKVHKGKVVALIQAGCFDCFADRNTIKRTFNSVRKDQVFTLKKTFVEDSVDAFGFILLHPFFFEPVKEYLLGRYCVSSQQLQKFDRWERVNVSGIILNVEIKMSGKSAMVVKLQDHRGDMFIYFDKGAKEKFLPILKPFNILFVNGRVMGTNRILCYAEKDKVFDITKKIGELMEDKSCRRRGLI